MTRLGNTFQRRYPIGAEVVPGAGVHFRLWAPASRRVEVVLEGDQGPASLFRLEPDGEGYFEGVLAGIQAGTRYRFRLDGSKSGDLTDPASRFQPQGPHGPSQVVDPLQFSWTDQRWAGIPSVEGQVLYELHVGTFTQQGTWSSAACELPHLADLGVSALEIMPVNEFPGAFGWGYDGVNLFAPFHGYGTPDDFRRFVDRAHALGIGVLLDVVYNHLGPEGEVLRLFGALLLEIPPLRVGRHAQLRRARERGRQGVRAHERVVLDQRVSSGWRAGRCHSGAVRHRSGAHRRGHRPHLA